MSTMISDKKWLIKSENKILGPYNFEQIEDLLIKKQISLIDEVRDTNTRWLYLRENAEFKKIIEAIRSRMDAKSESTKAIHTNVTGTITATERAEETNVEVPIYTNVALQVQEAAVVSETVTEVINRAKEESDTSQRHKANAKVKYAFQNDPGTQKQLNLFSKQFLILILIILVTGAGAIFGYSQYIKYSQQKNELDLISQVKRYQLLGLEQKAVDAFSKLPQPLQEKYIVDVLPLFPLLEFAGLVQVKDLESVERKSDLTLENKVSIFLARFWFYMQTQNFEMAQNQIVKAKSLQPANNIVIENEAILNLKDGQYRKALDSFVKLYSLDASGRFIVGAVQSLQGLPPSEKTKALPAIERLVDRHIATKYDYKKELLLVQMAFARGRNNDILFNLSWKEFLNTPTQMQSLFKKPLLTAPFSYLWKDLESYRATVRQGLSATDETLFQIHNYLESAQLSAAVDFADKNLNGIADIAVKQQISLLIDYALAKRVEVQSLEKTGQLDKKSELNHILLALNQIEINPNLPIDEHIKFFKSNNLKFYDQWIRLSRLIKLKSIEEIKLFLKENYFSDSDFIPVQEARGLIEQ